MQLFIKTSSGKTLTIDLEESSTLQTFLYKIQQKLQTSDHFYLFDIKNNRYIPQENLQAQIKRDLKLVQEMAFEVHNQMQVAQPQQILQQQFQPQNLVFQNVPVQGGFNPKQQNNQFQLPQQFPAQQQNPPQFNNNPYIHVQQPIQNQNNDVALQHLNQYDQKEKFEQQSIPNKNQQQQIIPSSQKFTGVNNNIQTQQLSEQINITPSLQFQLNEQTPQQILLVQTQNIQIQENSDTVQDQFQNQQAESLQLTENLLQQQLEELRKSQKELEEKINQLIGELNQVNNKIKYLEDSASVLQFINLNKQKLETTEQFLLTNIQNKSYVPLDNLTKQIQQDLDQIKNLTYQGNSKVHGNQEISNFYFHTQTLDLQNQFNSQGFQQQQNNQIIQLARQQISIQQPDQNQRNQDLSNDSQEVQYLKLQLQQQQQYVEQQKAQLQKQQQTIHGIIYKYQKAQKLFILSQIKD